MQHRKVALTLQLIGLVLCAVGFFANQTASCNNPSALADATQLYAYPLGVLVFAVAVALRAQTNLKRFLLGLDVIGVGVVGYGLIFMIGFSRCFTF